MNKILRLLYIFRDPIIVLSGIILASYLNFLLREPTASQAVLIIVIVYGSFELFVETAKALLSGRFALDYIAITAILLGVFTGNFLVAAIIVLMLSGGTTLEKYGMEQAKSSLTALTDRIPNSVFLSLDGQVGQKVSIEEVQVGTTIYIRRGEVIPLDGTLTSPSGFVDESSLTGEPYEVEKREGEIVRSGTVNVGDAMIVTVSHMSADSTYTKIVQMVTQAQTEKSPLIRLADRYSVVFTIITFILASLGYILSGGSLNRVLAVLVIATPCPLILATPIALMGGVNAAARRRIIMKRLASIEILARVNSIIFDKTGTITLGRPTVKEILVQPGFKRHDVLKIAAGIERSSIHPLAKAIVQTAQVHQIQPARATKITEHIGRGISGTIGGKIYTLKRSTSAHGMAIDLVQGRKHLAQFVFEDHIKHTSATTINRLKNLGIDIYMYTGDKKRAADALIAELGMPIQVYAECTPQDKQDGITKLKKAGRITAMVGDGINDAPALALADAGMVFSNEEHTAASEAADVVFLGGDFKAVIDTVLISRRTMHIARQSIIFGIGLSSLGMVVAAVGYVPAITGAFLQEAIDILVIFNALRTSRTSSHIS